MTRLLWPLGLLVTFAAGWTASSLGRPAPPPDVEQLQRQVTTLQARLQARENLAAARQSGTGTAPAVRPEPAAPRRPPGDGIVAAAVTEGRGAPDAGGTPGATARPRGDRPSARAAYGGPVTIEAALDRFYKYVEAMNGAGEGRGRWQQMRELVEDLRAMGDVGAQALMQVLAAGSDSDERRAAARLLGQLQVPQALGALKDIIDNDPDVLLRRAAASGLRQLQTPESIPIMERLLTNPGEDRMVRLSAAYGLAASGQPNGVAGLAQIFAESAGDGRGRDVAFRALASLDDDRAAPYMRQIAASSGEPGYQLRAIRYLATQGDQQSLPILQAIMNNPNAQQSVRDAAGNAYRALGGR
ncbi:MAG TPA: HEAT repeat domain-containing protein [Candidatus Binatia bacterium]|nr:HEAT repeat domain-containing protein [Candidatus Binatia bacterium]